MIKKIIKRILSNFGLMGAYEASRENYHRLRKLKFYFRDAIISLRDMRWTGQAEDRYWAASAELLFQYHKLEKGLCMPGPKRFFGYDPATSTLELLDAWRQRGYSTDNPIYQGAFEALHAYRERIEQTYPDNVELLTSKIDTELAKNQIRFPQLKTPVPFGAEISEQAIGEFECLVQARRSVRSYQLRPVPNEIVIRAIQSAQLSPSACNRQPCRVHVYAERKRIDELLSLQNGNRGFGHTAPLLLVLTAEASCFFDASERYEPYIDGGLFGMSLLLSLQAQGISSCCLNWCVEPMQDIKAHECGDIPSSERIIMYIAAGYAELETTVPRSPRRGIQDVFVVH
ncbi:MAG: nitroreductase family protein [Gammaproteobacteria bacterium]|nr:nitroreductase family protein [Gammaproteobacteria bacterium]MBU2435906.1 nitroreductase family protein [Gammaproteobacteria bacterium]MBU2449313.1 nitroreductase family protein [Gammaproteobacteria bacterium]